MRIFGWLAPRLSSSTLAKIMAEELRCLERLTGVAVCGEWTIGFHGATIELQKDKLLISVSTDAREPAFSVYFTMIDKYEKHRDWSSQLDWQNSYPGIDVLYLVATKRCPGQAKQLIHGVRFNNEDSVRRGVQDIVKLIQICGKRYLEGDYSEFYRDPLVIPPQA